jgi:hypothetical protein
MPSNPPPAPKKREEEPFQTNLTGKDSLLPDATPQLLSRSPSLLREADSPSLRR